MNDRFMQIEIMAASRTGHKLNPFRGSGDNVRSESESTEIEADRDRRDMARLEEGHDAALNDLMDRHSEKLYRYLIRSLQNREDAADLAQETFERVYRNRAKYDPGKKFATWLYAIASNLVRDRYRWRVRHSTSSMDAVHEETGKDRSETFPDPKPSPIESIQSDERGEQVRRAVAALPEKLRVPLILSEYEEKSHAEIGEILRCSAKAVEVRIYRARQSLRESLGGLMGAA